MLVIKFTGAGARAVATHRSEERDVLLYPGDGRHGDPLRGLVRSVHHLHTVLSPRQVSLRLSLTSTISVARALLAWPRLALSLASTTT